MLEQAFRCRIYQADGDVRVIRPSGVFRAEPAEPTQRPAGRAVEIPVSSIMSSDVICAQRSIGVEALAALMVRYHIGSIPVVDDRGKPIGMITKLDLIERLSCLPGRTAEDGMMPFALSLGDRATVAHAAAMMALEDDHHIPVVTASGAIIGIVSSLDVVRWLARQEGMVGGSGGGTE